MSKERISVDLSQNKIFVPGSGNLPMVGLDQAKLAEAQTKTRQEELQLRRMLLSTWQCVNCKQVFPGKEVKVRRHPRLQIELHCPECGDRVVMKDDALNLVRPPR